MERNRKGRNAKYAKLSLNQFRVFRFISRISRALLFSLFICLISFPHALQAQTKSKPSDARSAVQAFFSLLKSQQYQGLYDFLPSQLQQQITREQLAFSLKRLDAFITIEKMEISRVQQKGDFAVVDTTIYGLLKKPMKMNGNEVKEGRVSVQQYLFKEKERWKVVTADNRMRDYFLKRNPEFNKQFQITQPRFEFNQGGNWTLIGQEMRRR